LSGQAEPVDYRCSASAGIETEVLLGPGGHAGHLDAHARCRVGGEAKANGVPAEAGGQVMVKRAQHRRPVGVGDEQLQSQTPVVVTRHSIVESEDV